MVRKISLSVLGVLFLLFAYFQWNDADGLKWILYYVMIAALFFTSLFNKNRGKYIYCVLGLSVLWMITLLPAAIDWFKDGMPSIVESMKASSPYIELVREFLGLVISVLALVYLLFDLRRQKLKDITS